MNEFSLTLCTPWWMHFKLITWFGNAVFNTSRAFFPILTWKNNTLPLSVFLWMQTYVFPFFHLLLQNDSCAYLLQNSVSLSDYVYCICIKTVDPTASFKLLIHQTAKVRPKTILKGPEINLGCDCGQLRGLPRKEPFSQQYKRLIFFPWILKSVPATTVHQALVRSQQGLRAEARVTSVLAVPSSMGHSSTGSEHGRQSQMLETVSWQSQARWMKPHPGV